MAGIGNAILFAQGMKLQPSTSQDITEMQKTADDVSSINFTGDPNGNVSANPSSLCHDPNSGNIYFKQSGTGDTGWVQIGGAANITITPEEGFALTSDAFTFSGQMANMTPVMTALSSLGTLYWENRSWQTQYVVDPSSTTGLRGTYATIQAAIDAAFADGAAFATPRTIFIRPGTYIEDLNLRAGMIFKADCLPGDPNFFVQNVTITGNHTLPDISLFYSEGICWSVGSGDLFAGATDFNIINAFNSSFINTAGYIVNSPTSSSYINMSNCYFNGTSDGTPQFDVNAAAFFAQDCRFNGTSLNFVSSGVPVFKNCYDIGNVYLAAAPLRATNCNFVGFNAECVIQTTGGPCLFVDCGFACASAPTQAVDYGTATPPKFINCYVYPENVPVTDFTNQVALNAENGPAWKTTGNVLRGVRADTDYVCGDADAYVGITNTSAPRAVSLPVNAFIGQQVYVMDESGGAGGNNITVTGPSLINGTSSFVINNNFQGVLFRCFDGSNWVTLMVSDAASAAPLLKNAMITLTSAQLKALDTVPIQIIPAQGAGTIITPISITAKFVCPTGEAFTATNDISLFVTDLSGQFYGQIATPGFAGPTVDTYCTTTTTQMNTIDASDLENTNTVLGIVSGAITGNPADDNTLIVNVLYKVTQLV